MSWPPVRKAWCVKISWCSADVGLDALDHHLGQRVAHARDRGLARVAVRDDLADQRIVVRRHVVAGVDVAIDAHARAARRVPQLDRARRGHEGLRRPRR